MHYVYGRYITSQPVNIEIIMLYPRKPKIMRYMQNIVCYINIILYIMYLMRRNAQKKNRGYLEESIERLYDLFRVMETKRKKKENSSGLEGEEQRIKHYNLMEEQQNWGVCSNYRSSEERLKWIHQPRVITLCLAPHGLNLPLKGERGERERCVRRMHRFCLFFFCCVMFFLFLFPAVSLGLMNRRVGNSSIYLCLLWSFILLTLQFVLL